MFRAALAWGKDTAWIWHAMMAHLLEDRNQPVGLQPSKDLQAAAAVPLECPGAHVSQQAKSGSGSINS
jgi:hypothetical protein